MNYLLVNDIDTDEEVYRMELKAVKNISVMPGSKINEIGGWYGCKAKNNKDYIMIQYYSKCFGLFEKSNFYITFE